VSPPPIGKLSCRCWIRDRDYSLSVDSSNEWPSLFHGNLLTDRNRKVSVVYTIECDLGVYNLPSVDFMEEVILSNVEQEEAIIFSLPSDLFADEFDIIFRRESIRALKLFFLVFVIEKSPIMYLIWIPKHFILA